MFEVICPTCEEKRMVAARKPWMTGPVPYVKVCKKCVGKGKAKSQETKDKLSAAVKALQTPEVLKAKSDFMKDHPELWLNLKQELGALSRIGTTHTDETKQKMSNALKGRPKSQETKDKISKTMKDKNNESN